MACIRGGYATALQRTLSTLANMLLLVWLSMSHSLRDLASTFLHTEDSLAQHLFEIQTVWRWNLQNVMVMFTTGSPNNLKQWCGSWYLNIEIHFVLKSTNHFDSYVLSISANSWTIWVKRKYLPREQTAESVRCRNRFDNTGLLVFAFAKILAPPDLRIRGCYVARVIRGHLNMHLLGCGRVPYWSFPLDDMRFFSK